MIEDIMAIQNDVAINNKSAICSVMPTGKFTKLLIRANYPKDLTIENIKNKYHNRFNNPSYYYGGSSPDGGAYTG